ncbi:MAG: serine hydrolase domain-containing protein [Planctomycetota bacterium]
MFETFSRSIAPVLRQAAFLWASMGGASLVGASLVGVAAAQEPSTPLARLDTVDWAGWRNLTALLTDVHTRTGVPAIAAAMVQNGKVVEAAAGGVRQFGTDEAVQADDPFHLGSVTKSFTAAVIGKLIEEGRLDWDTRVVDVLTDVEMHAGYRAVTVEQILRHQSGLPAYTDRRPAGHPADREYSGTLAERRAAFLADVLAQAPIAAPGERAEYSNAGYALLGHLAERVTGESWEALVRRIVFAPLDMTSGGFGIPATPVGHVARGAELLPVPRDAYPKTELIAPAGNIHCAIGDLAQYARAHLVGLAGDDGWLRAATLRRLHRAPGPEGATGYASGWIVAQESGEAVHRHGGTVGASYAEVRLYPERDCAVVVLTNVNLGVGEALAQEISRALLARHAPAPAIAGFVQASPSNDAASVTITEGTSTPAEDARVWQLVEEMSRALNDEDRQAYRALFAPSYNQRDGDSMFDFMARNVLPTRGAVHAFHDLQAPLVVPHLDRPMRAVIFHLENGFPGYFGFGLDEDGKIEEFSLFVKSDVCPHGPHRHCPSNVRTLDEDFE